MDSKEGVGRRIVGVAVRNTKDSTTVVEVLSTVTHPTYGKVLRRRQKFLVHDEKNCVNKGDTVAIVACRPVSKRKSWRVEQVLSSRPE